LRIAVLSRNFSAQGGGAERYAIKLVEQLVARHDVHVFAQSVSHSCPGVTYHTISGLPGFKPRWINQLWFAFATWKATRQGFDVVHSHETSWHGDVQTVHVLPVRHTLFVGRKGAVRFLRWMKVLASPRLLAYLFLERARFTHMPSRTVVATSDLLRQALESSYPHLRGETKVVAPGVDCATSPAAVEQRASIRVRLGLPVCGHGLLYVGNDFLKKGLPTLLHAMPLLPSDYWLAVVGQGEQAVAMYTLASKLALVGRVHFLGALADVEPAYMAADCLVHPTLEDTYGMVVLEAMAHKLPVVVSNARYCGISAELTDGLEACLLDDPESAPAVAQRVLHVFEDVHSTEKMTREAYQFASERSWTRVAEHYELFYQQMTTKNKPRWLVLAHAFNMDGRAASQTITDKLPHLEAAGVEVVVLSGVSGRKDRHYEHHQLWPVGPAGVRFEARHVLQRRLGKGLLYRMVLLVLTLFLLPLMLMEKLWRPIESSWSWWFSAYLKGRAMARQRPFDLIYSTGGAYAAHLAGRALKRSLGIPWLAEVHDPFLTPGTAPHTAQQKMQAKVETLICREADVAVWFTEQALASARVRHPELGDRGRMLLPGIDQPFKELPPYQRGPKFVVGHFGSLSATRNLVPFIEALEALQHIRPDLVAAIELQVTGGPLDPVSAARIESSPIRGCIRHLGRIEADPITGLSGREQILRRMRSVDVLLLLHGQEPICAEYIPSKLYEYLWMQRPVLATVHCNPQMAAILRGQGHVVVETGQGNANLRLADELLSLYQRWHDHGLPDSGLSSPYTTQAAVEYLLCWTGVKAERHS